MKKQKNALAVHDISCVGRCSLTVALPILSAAGIETSVLPTAVLSTHTGGFTGYTYRDLTEDVLPISDHWATMDLKFDAIYSGYLGSIEQVDLVLKLIERHAAEGCIALVDPVMADNGKLYAGFAESFPAEMKRLCAASDIMCPNITEACLMLGEEYKDGPYTKEYIEGLVHRLSDIGGNRVVLTGVCFDDKLLGAAAYDPKDGKIDYAFAEWIPGYLHGTGDVFGSALLGALLRGKTLSEASEIAVKYTRETIAVTFASETELRMGPCFELTLPYYMELLKG
jgi:pyridoxine kinase